MKYLRQSTASVVVVGPFPDKSTGLAVTGLASQSGRAIKAGTGGAFTPASWSHDGGGHYLVGLGTGDTDTVGRLRLTFDSGATYLPVWEDYSVLSAAVYDVLFGATAPSTYAGGAVASVTAAVTLPAAPADWITAASVSAAAVTKVQAGLSTYAGGDTAGTATLLARVPGTVQPQTGDAYARLGVNGAGLTALVPPTDYQQRSVAVTLPANPPAGFLGTTSFAAGATLPRVTLVDTTTDVTNAGAIGLGATAPVGWINTAAFAASTLVPSDVQKVKGGDPIPADLNNVGLKPTGLDQIAVTAPAGVPTTFPGWLLWTVQRFKRSHKTPTSLVVESDAGAPLTTQAVSDDGAGSESISAPS